jgi:carboxyl-terminal processing protease
MSSVFSLSTYLSTFAILIVSVLLVPSVPSEAQLLSSKPRKLTLSCIHVYPIQRKYLDRHVNYSAMSDKLEKQSVDQFIKRLDGSKLYLLEKDAKKIEKSMSDIFAQLKKKDCSAIQKANQLYKDRVKERVAYAKKYLGKGFKFDKKTKVVLDPDKRKRAKTLKEANEFHNKYLHYQVATYLAADETEAEAKKKIIKNYERALKRIDEDDEEDLYVSWLDSFSRSMDPHSSYLSNDALQDFEIQMRLSLDGIGATLSSKDGFTTIEQLIPGGAAFKSGQLKPKDKIMAVAQGKDGFVNVVEMPLRDVVRKIRGPKGSEVRLKILRKLEDETKKFEVTLVRDKIKLEDDAASLKVFNRNVNGQKKKIGLVTLPSFYADNRRNGRSASKDVRKMLREASKKSVDAVVLDLSNNGGGSLRDAVDIAGLFFARGNVVKQSQREVDGLDSVGYEVLRDNDRTVDYDGPLVVLTSRISASASEIVAGTLQDYKRAVIVGGDHTFGKGSVQSVEYLPPGLGAIKTTVGMFFTAGGNSTQHRGVDADVLIPSTYSASEEIGEKTLDYSLPPKKIPNFVSQEAYKFGGKDAFKLVEKDMVQRLQKASKARVAISEDFKEIEEDIKKIKERGDEIEVAELLDKKDEKDGKDDKKDDAKKDEDEDRVLTREERKEKYFERADVQEAINIAADLINEMNGVKVTITQKDVQKEMKQAPAAN